MVGVVARSRSSHQKPPVLLWVRAPLMIMTREQAQDQGFRV